MRENAAGSIKKYFINGKQVDYPIATESLAAPLESGSECWDELNVAFGKPIEVVVPLANLNFGNRRRLMKAMGYKQVTGRRNRGRHWESPFARLLKKGEVRKAKRG